MSEADKLFEELEYYVDTENEDVLIYSNYHDKAFWFFKKKKTIYANDRDGTSSGITMQELKAINMKCKELGWIE